MATAGIRASLTLVTGAAAGFLAAVLLQEPPAPRVPGDVGSRDRAPAAAPPEPAAARAHMPITPSPTSPAAKPPVTLTDILRLDGDFAQTAALYNLIADKHVDELERLIAQADGLGGGSDRRAALSILYARYAELDPAAALRHLQARRGSDVQAELQVVFRAWSKADLEAAVASAAGLPPELRHAAGTAILASREDLSWNAQREIARRLQIEGVLPQIVMMQSSSEDPRLAWESALTSEEGPLTQGRLMAVAQGWARQDPLAALDAVMALSNPSLRQMLQGQILQEWSSSDPRAAVDWAMGQPPSAERRQLTSIALTALAGEEPRLALEMAQDLEGQERDVAVNGVLSRWASDDPIAAAASLASVTSGNARRNALATVAAAYARHDPQAALQWLSTLNGDEVVHATSLMFFVLANQDVVEAGSLVGRMPGQPSRQLAAQAVAQVWARHDVEAGARWVESLADESLRRQATASLVGQWSNFDREAALRYVERIPAAAERDAALVSVMQAHHGDVEFGERMFQQLTVPEHRMLAARLLYFNLRHSDPQRAERYREVFQSRAEFGVSR